ncbi:CYFA0S37e00342g1_1 [Cyberlindnera fabianii]|nr:CYFA0S37e00342g1_1 [Cyberlindnera fabianii]
MVHPILRCIGFTVLTVGLIIALFCRESNISSYKDGLQNIIHGQQAPVRATFVSVIEENDLWPIVDSIKQVQDRFNNKFNYDWVFLSRTELSEEFKSQTSSAITGNTKFGLIPERYSDYPEWINSDDAKDAFRAMNENSLIPGDSASIRFDNRYKTGFLHKHDLLLDYEYYWRVDPSIKIHCDIDYDVFQFMKNNDKKFGFAISLHEYQVFVKTLWDTTNAFMKENPQYTHENNMMKFISDDNGDTYNLCYFWSNFEIASLDFWRDEAYSKYFDHLDKAGGFFFERWSEGPIHSLAVSLLLDKSQVHIFQDVGYYHVPFTTCPIDSQFRTEHKCSCDPKSDFTFRGFSCGKKYFEANDLEKPVDWEAYTDRPFEGTAH